MSLRHRLLSQSTVIFGARLFGAGVIFLAQAAMARLWGPTLLGEYLLIIASVNIIGVLMPLGFESIGTYFAAEYRARGDRPTLIRFMRRAYGFVALSALALLLAGAPVASLFGEPGRVLATHWLPATVMATATAVVYCNSALLVGLKRPFAGFFADTVFRPMLIGGAFSFATLTLNSDARLDELVWLLAAGFALIAAAQFAWVWRATADLIPTGIIAPLSEPRRWWRFALPWAVTALATEFFFDLDMLILSNIMDKGSLAVFGVCTRVFSIVAFGVSAVYAVTLPDMFEASAARDRVSFLKQTGEANLIATGISLGLLVAVAIGAPLVLAIFGPAFMAGALPLAILCVALCVRSAFGPAALVLSLNDRPYAGLPAIALGMAMLVGCNILLVPTHGLMGAAASALIAQTFWSAAMWLTAKRLAGIDVSVFPRFAGLFARRRIA